MRAVRFDDYGPLDVLDVREVPDPEPGPGQVRIAVRAAGINPGENGIREGALKERWPSTFPEGEGSDFAGVVDALGAGVTDVRVGDEVIGFTNDRASHADLVVVDSEQLTPRPSDVPWEVAGALFVAGTSGVALVEAVHVGEGETVVVSSAAGGTGVFTTQLALQAGARVIALAGPDNHAWLRERGAQPIDYHGDGLAGRIRTALDGGAPDAVLDTSGRGYVELGLELGVDPQRIATIADFAAGEKGAKVVSHSSVGNAGTLARLAALVAEGRLEVPIAATYPLTDVRRAYDRLSEGHTRGKIVLIP